MYFKTAEDMRKLVEENEEKDFPYELYNIFIKEIEHDAKMGLSSHTFCFSTSQINKDIEWFPNLQKDWKILEKKLVSLGFHCSSNIHLFGILDFNTYHITIMW